jgi:hypothetical protein
VEQPHATTLLQLDERAHLAAELLDVGREQLVLRERLEDGDGRLVVVGPLDQILRLDDPTQLAAEERDAACLLHVGLRREQAEDEQLADAASAASTRRTAT